MGIVSYIKEEIQTVRKRDPAMKSNMEIFLYPGDHGNGVIIGETAEIGNYVTLYQGVTLGGTGKEQGKRHPTLQDYVMVSAGAKILGSITIGANSKIGAGAVVLKEIPPDCTVVGVPGRIVKAANQKISGIDLEQFDPIRKEMQELRQENKKLLHRLKAMEEDMDHYKENTKNNSSKKTGEENDVNFYRSWGGHCNAVS